MSYPSSPLSPYLGALELQFSPSIFYIVLYLSLMVLHQLESPHFDDFNLIYSQNKNRGFDSIFFKNPTSLLQTLHKTNPTNNNLQNSTQYNPKTHLQPKQNSFYPHLWFSPTSKSQKMKLRFFFLTLASSNLHF